MIEWQRVQIEDLHLGFFDGPHATPKPSDSGPIFLGIKNIANNGHLDFEKIRHISEEEFPKWTRRVEPRKDDIVFSYEATLNRYAIIPEGFRGCLGRRLALIRPNIEIVNPEFLFYYFFCKDWRDTITNNTVIGSTVDRIPLIEFPKFKISMPPLDLQSRIVAILSPYDKLIMKIKRRIEILEMKAQTLYNEWFINFRFPNYENTEFRGSEVGLIPKGWEFSTLDQFGDIIKEKYNNSHNNLPLLDLKKMPKKTLLVGEMGSPEELTTSRIIFEEYDILFGSIRPYLHKVALAPCKGVTNTSVFVIRAKEERFRAMLATLLSSIDAIEWATQYSGGTKMPVIKWDILSKMPVIQPDGETLQKFQDTIWPMMRVIGIESKRIQYLNDTRDILLAKLFSGEIDVSELDIEVTT